MRPTLRGLVIGVGALVISSLGLQASDWAQNVDTNLSALLGSTATVACQPGMVSVNVGGSLLCVDQYEATAADRCPVMEPQSVTDTSINLLETECRAISVPDRMPWRFVSLSEAQQLCARNDKRLPTNEEWYRIALTQADNETCVIEAGAAVPTGVVECRTESGVHDLVGNVWEWVDGAVTDGRYAGRPLPPSGYVTVVDNDGVVLETEQEPRALYGADYAWTSEMGTFGIIRGGYFESGDDAGLYAQNLSVPFDLRTKGVGFRCVHDR